MRVLLFAFLLSLSFTPPAMAQDAAGEGPAASVESADRVQILEDDTNGALSIVIDGKIAARFTADAISARGEIKASDPALSDAPQEAQP